MGERPRNGADSDADDARDGSDGTDPRDDSGGDDARDDSDGGVHDDSGGTDTRDDSDDDAHRDRWRRLPSGRGPTPAEDADSEPSIPLDGDVLLYTGATASIGPERVEPLLRETQSYLRERAATYRRRYESAVADDERRVLLVPEGHWAEVGDELTLPEREVDAARRAHAQQLKRIGSKTDRREEFETALEIREAVVLGE